MLTRPIPLRERPYGTWYLAGPDGLLELPAEAGRPDRVGRLVRLATQLRDGAIAGVLPVADLTRAGDRVHLRTAGPPTPTVADLLAGPPPHRPWPAPQHAGSAATILNETAQALLALHAAGLVHGDVGPATVVLTSTGRAALVEVGLPGLDPAWVTDPQRDVTAWARLARQLADAWAADDAAGGALLHRCADLAADSDLRQARAALLAGRQILPPGFATRDRLTVAVAIHLATVAAPDLVPAGAGDTRGAERPTILGRWASAATPTGGLLRFGPGVPRRSEPIRRVSIKDDPPRRQRSWWSFAATAGLLAAAAVPWLPLHREPLTVTTVTVRGPAGTLGCDATADFQGTVHTNGTPGELSYRWQRGDGTATDPVRQRMPAGQHSVVVHLNWQVRGAGAFTGTATLVVSAPPGEHAATASARWYCR